MVMGRHDWSEVWGCRVQGGLWNLLDCQREKQVKTIMQASAIVIEAFSAHTSISVRSGELRGIRLSRFRS